MTFNVSVDNIETPKGSDESAGAKDEGETKCRADDGDNAVSTGGGFCYSAAAAAAAARKISTLPSPVGTRPTPSVESQKQLQHFGLDRNSLTTPGGFRVS